jgi:hypothetical protein
MVIFVSSVVWLPDVLGRHSIVLDTLVTTAGDRVQLTQLWNGDGYLTELRHEEANGARWVLVIDPDAKKSWKGHLTQSSNSCLIGVKLWRNNYVYDSSVKSLTNLNGKVREAFQLPRRGSMRIPTT